MEDKFTDEVLRHQGLIHKICRMYRDSREDQEDLFQEIVYQLWKSYPQFQGKSKITTWMYRIGLNTAMATFRKPTVKIDHCGVMAEQKLSQEPQGDSWKEDLLFAAIRELDQDERAFIALYLEDLSYAEISEVIGISQSNVGVRLNRIKTKLKTILNK
ncbi:RNA polymerase subunit sigma-70 [Flavobacterium sp. IR1]|nr:RNA polymerase subunit sigma-70 [Flavobacterium sp. IR1]